MGIERIRAIRLFLNQSDEAIIAIIRTFVGFILLGSPIMTCIIFNNTIVELLRIDFTNRWSKCRFAVVTRFNLLEIDNAWNMESAGEGS